ncbi:EthD family reductase [Hydrogenophaga sp.]|uniref:EthD family reductase n=1 Tax=Hydrogenophaga sp. TaxID=1904254 RepID=UPI003F70CDEB
MHRLLVTYPSPPDANAFLDYYVNTHVPLARRWPGLRGCRWFLPQALGQGTPPNFLHFEADFDSEADLMAALQSPMGAQVAADVPNYSPAGATLVHYDVASS